MTRTISRGPKPALTLEAIAETAIRVADADGLDAVSMQRVAAELGFTKMALYRYLPGKSDLLALMVEHALGGPPDLGDVTWRQGLRAWAHALLAASPPHNRRRPHRRRHARVPDHRRRLVSDPRSQHRQLHPAGTGRPATGSGHRPRRRTQPARLPGPAHACAQPPDVGTPKPLGRLRPAPGPTGTRLRRPAAAA